MRKPASTTSTLALAAVVLAAVVPVATKPAHAAIATPGERPRARTADGLLEGRMEAGVRSFRGIPFAAAPTGARRWQPPAPAVPWKGVRDAGAFGARCMQLPLFSDMVFRSPEGSEDCLYLNLWSPATKPGAKLPVLVYFHGGGLVAGDGSEPRYDGASMARQGIVAITVNYRLGVFGFLAHPGLSAGSPRKASGNYGLMDQAAALEWVRRNIAAFGGDPRRVTIAGESAGAFSVNAQMASPLAKHLIHGAIGQSGSVLGLKPPPRLAEAEADGRRFGEQLGAPAPAQLRSLPAAALLAANARPDAPRFGVIVDGYVLPQAPASMFASGAQAQVPLLAGWNSAEGSGRELLGDAGPGEQREQHFRSALERLYGDKAGAARQAYAGEVERAARELASDRIIGFGTWRWIDLHARHGRQPVYRYYYTHPRPAPEAAPAAAPIIVAAAGAGHSVEIEYVLGNLDRNPVYAWTSADRALSSLAQAYFANFIKTGNPNGTGLPRWPALDAGGAGDGTPVMLLEPGARAEPASDGAHHRFHQQMLQP